MLLRETFRVAPVGYGAIGEAPALVSSGETPRSRNLATQRDRAANTAFHTLAHLDRRDCTSEVKEAFGGDTCHRKDDLVLPFEEQATPNSFVQAQP